MGKTTFELNGVGIEVNNYLLSSQLTKFLKRYTTEELDGGDKIIISLGDATLILAKLREVKSSLASKLNRVIKEFNAREEERLKARPIVSYPIDRRGEYLRRGCLVRYSYPEQASLEHDIFWATFVGMREDGMALIKNDVFYAYLCVDKVYRLWKDSDKDVYAIDPTKLTLETRTIQQIRADYNDLEDSILRPIFAPEPETSGMKRKKKKSRKLPSVSVGLTGIGAVE